MENASILLKQYWGYDFFRGNQEDIISSVMEGKDTLALLPTGGGKSLCFQLPGMMMNGMCLVITPLIALMKDQVANLQKKGIPALVLHSGLSYYEVVRTMEDAVSGRFKFLYLSPERLETKLFKEYLPAFKVNLVAVDEAHCVSNWGYDFRPSYLRIANLRNELPSIPLLALTASATPLVQTDIVKKLCFASSNIFRQSFERPNISYSVFKVESKINKLVEILQNVKGSSIVYCRNRRVTKEVTGLLSMQNIDTVFYHAGLLQADRNLYQENWINNNARVIVCTNAFGMGIDKPDVRTVIHYDIPDCLENYYQEAGRAGRDNKKAYAVLLYQAKDVIELKAFPEKRFPSVSDIKKVYQSLCDYLEIPVGLGEGNFYDFDLNNFINNFKLDFFLVSSVLKALEHEEYLSFNENIFLPSQVNFITDKDFLHEFEALHPKLEPLIKCLLHLYSGIIDNRVSVFEKQIAKILKCDTALVKEGLQQLKSFGIIEYLPQKETPQIHFLTNRAPARYLQINYENYLKRKEQYKDRVRKILAYIDLTDNCRSIFIAKYFNDVLVKSCGICDICLAKKANSLSGKEFDIIRQQVFETIKKDKISVKELINHLQMFKKDKIWETLEYLQSEQKIIIEDGIIMIGK